MSGTTELDAARQIAAGAAPSPTRFAGFTLWAIRLSGTGIAERPAWREFVDRDPGVWLSPEMQARAAGLPVIWQHPRKGTLDGTEFERRVVGTVMLPYVAAENGIEDSSGAQLWGVSRVFDEDANAAMAAGGVSTSPAVAFRHSDGNEAFPLADGSHLLREGVPSLLDHVALLPNGQSGVWDHNGPPTGVRCDSTKENSSMSETAAAAGMNGKTPKLDGADPVADPKDGEKLDKILAACDSLMTGHAEHGSRLDALCRRMDGYEGGAPKTEQNPSMPTPTMPPVAAADAERAEEAAKTEAQSRADSVAQCFGEQAPKPLSGEALTAYRARLARRYQRHCAEFKDVDLGAIRNDSVFSGIEQRIYADAAAAASKGPEVPHGELREVTTIDPHTGRRTSKFFGTPTIFRRHSRPPQFVSAFRQQEGVKFG